MKTFSIPAAIVASFHSRDLYRDVARRWSWQPFAYLLLVLTLSWLPYTVRSSMEGARFVRDVVPAVVAQVPPIEIDHGVVRVDAPQPHVIEDPEGGPPIAVLDTTGATDPTTVDARLVLTADSLILRRNERETRVWSLAEIDRFELDADRVDTWLTVFGRWGPLALFPVLVVGSYVYRFVQAVAYALIGLLVARSSRTSLDFAAVLRIALVAITPALALNTLVSAVGATIPFVPILYVLIAIGYVRFGVVANAEPTGAPYAEGTS